MKQIPEDDGMCYVEKINARVTSRTTRGIANAVSDLIVTGEIPPGQKLPTTRDLASSLNVSAGMVSDAWKALSAEGVLETHGRRGTFVRDVAPAPWRQFRHVAGLELPVDLSTGYPDPELLLDLRPYLAKLSTGPRFKGYPKHEVDPQLAYTLRRLLPVPVQEDNIILATHVIGALAEIMPTLGPPGTRVIVSDPEFAPYLDLLERNRFIPTPVPFETDGMNLSAIKEAISDGAKAILMQPRLHNPTGIRTSIEKLEAIAKMCEHHGVWLFEGDFYGDLLTSPQVSAAVWAPKRTVHITSFSKDLHPDIRVAVVAGSPRLIQETSRRRFGGFTVSRVNQDLLRLLLEDPAVETHVRSTRRVYARRQKQFCEILRQEGIEVTEGGAFNVWVPVCSEHSALVYLAAKGINVAPGSAFQVNQREPHIRVSTNAISEDLAATAKLIARASFVQRIGG